MRRGEGLETRRGDPGGAHTPAGSVSPNLPRASQGPGGLLDAPHPGAGGASKGGAPCRKAPMSSHLSVAGSGRLRAHRPDRGRLLQPAATPDPSEKLRSDAFQTAHTATFGRRSRKGSPARAAELRVWSAGAGGCARPSGLPDPGAKVGWSRGAIFRCAAGAAPPALAAPRSCLGTRRSLGPRTHLHSSQRQIGVGPSGAAAARRSCPQVQPAPAIARPPARGSAGPRPPAAPPQPLCAPVPPRRPRPRRPRPQGGPAPPRPRRPAGGAHPGKCRRRAPAAPPSRPGRPMDGLQVPAGCAARASAGGPRRSGPPQPLVGPCGAVAAAWLAAWGSRELWSGEEGGRGKSELSAALVEAWSYRRLQDPLGQPSVCPVCRGKLRRGQGRAGLPFPS